MQEAPSHNCLFVCLRPYDPMFFFFFLIHAQTYTSVPNFTFYIAYKVGKYLYIGIIESLVQIQASLEPKSNLNPNTFESIIIYKKNFRNYLSLQK